MAKMKEDPLWMRMVIGVILRIFWGIVGFFAPIVGLSFGSRYAMMSVYRESGWTLLLLCLAGTVLGVLLGPMLYVPHYQEGAGTLDEVRRLSREGKSRHDGEE